MSDIRTLITTIFANFTVDQKKIPVSFMRYKGKETTYVTWMQYDMDNSYAGDNELLGYVGYYDFDVYSKGNYTNIIEAADGEIACNTYANEKPDLVIMDITMPNKTGIEALRDIKASDPGAKVVMCSAMGQESMVVEAIKLGALDFIVKPFKPDRILQTVQKVLG